MDVGNPLKAKYGISVVFNTNVTVNAINTSLVIFYSVWNEFDQRFRKNIFRDNDVGDDHEEVKHQNDELKAKYDILSIYENF